MASSKSSGSSSSRPNKYLHSIPSSNVKSKAQEKLAEDADSSPVKNSLIASKKVIQSIKTPTIVTENYRHRSSDDGTQELRTSTRSNEKAKIFSLHTGLSSTEPVILISAEFQPIYSGNSLASGKNQLGKMLHLKETAGMINARTSISILSQSEDSKDAVVANKNELTKFINKEDDSIVRLAKEMNNALNVLDVTSFSLSIKDYFSDSVKSLYEILIKGGFPASSIRDYTETKMWMQSLIEIKKTLLTHSPDLVESKFSRQINRQVNSPFDLSDIDDAPAGVKNFWINRNYDKLPTIGEMTNFGTIKANVKLLNDFLSVQYMILPNANSTQKTPKKSNKSAGFSMGTLAIGPSILVPFESSGRDISIICHILFREAMYSRMLLDSQFASKLASKFGYTVDPNGENMKVWDYLIGKFPKSVLDFTASPVGNGNSLLSYSQKSISAGQNDFYNILTFENNFIEGKNITPGTYYYLDSSLNTSDGKNFELNRLNDFIASTSEAFNTTESILKMMGFKPEGDASQGSLKERYDKIQTPEDIDIEEFINRLSVVVKNYSNYLTGNNGKIQDISGGGGLFSGAWGKSGPKGNKDTTAVRLSALLCKAAIQPVDAFKPRSNNLRALLFMWLMNVVLQKAEGIGNTITQNYLKQEIAKILTDTSAGFNKQKITDAANSQRTFPSKIENISGKSSIDFFGTIQDRWEDAGYEILSEVFQTAEDAKNKEVDAERKQAYNAYLASVGNRVFEIDADKGIWPVIVDMLKSIYDSKGIYTTQDVTAYSGINQVAYLYCYFDLILRIIAAQVPENLLGSYTQELVYGVPTTEVTNQAAVDANKANDAIRELGIYSPYVPEKTTYDPADVKVRESGLIIDKPDSETLNEYFDYSKIKSPASKSVKKIKDSLLFFRLEEYLATREVGIVRSYLHTVNKAVTSLRNYMDQNFEKYLADINALFQTDNSLTKTQRNALINLTLSDEQFKLARYVMSEYRDRARVDDSSSKLRTLPAFAAFEPGFYDFLSVNEIDHISYSLLSSYFANKEFLKTKGNNKKIYSVGIPQKMLRSLNTSVRMASETSKGLKQGIVRIKFWKLDKLHPDVVYEPKSFLFEVNRFPTRVLSNWNLDTFLDDTSNMFEIPSKVIYPDGRIRVDRDFDDAFPDSDYGDFLEDEQKEEIYANHAMSFLLEQYIRWFTDLQFEETRFFNYAPLSEDMKTISQQYNKYVSTAPKDNTPPPSPEKPTTGYKTSDGSQKTKISLGKAKSIVVAKNLSKTLKPALSKKAATKKPKTSFVIPMDDTIEKYFENETYMSSLDDFKRRILYPKKFDRVFNVAMDPDDFYVDQTVTDPDVMEALARANVLKEVREGSVVRYKHRDMSQKDVSLEEFFVTVEPFDFLADDEGV